MQRSGGKLALKAECSILNSKVLQYNNAEHHIDNLITEYGWTSLQRPPWGQKKVGIACREVAISWGLTVFLYKLLIIIKYRINEINTGNFSL